MIIFWALLRRELGTFFLSWTGYVILAAVMLLTGGSFVQLINALGTTPWLMPVTQMFFGTYFIWSIIILTAPMLTMRLFALEKASGTFETLMTTQVSDLQVVIAKFTAALIMYMVIWLPLLIDLFIVNRYSNQAHAMDYSIVSGMYLGILLTGVMFLSFGCLASALTRSQMVAAMVSIAFSFGQFILASWARNQSFAAGDDWQSQILARLNLIDQMTDFARGVVDTRTVIFYLSVTFLFLFLTLRVVESRRWK